MPNKGSPFNLFDPTFVAGPFEVGTWRSSRSDETVDDPYESAIRLALRGYSAQHIARQFPKVWVRQGRGIVHLINSLNGDFNLDSTHYRDYEE